MLLAVAVILGIVLLQQFDTDIDTGQVSTNPAADAEVTTTRRPTLTSLATTTTTTRLRAKSEVTVLVANGAGVRGLGATTTNALKNLGYTTLAAVDASPPSVDRTVIQFAEGYEADAREVASALNQPATVVTRLSAPPVEDVGEAKVVVVLGLDYAPTTTTTVATGAGSTTSTTRR